MCVIYSVHAYMLLLLFDMTEISPVQLDRACLLMNAWTVNPIPGGVHRGGPAVEWEDRPGRWVPDYHGTGPFHYLNTGRALDFGL